LETKRFQGFFFDVVDFCCNENILNIIVRILKSKFTKHNKQKVSYLYYIK